MSDHPQRFWFGYTDSDRRTLRGRLTRGKITTDFCFGPVVFEVPRDTQMKMPWQQDTLLWSWEVWVSDMPMRPSIEMMVVGTWTDEISQIECTEGRKAEGKAACKNLVIKAEGTEQGLWGKWGKPAKGSTKASRRGFIRGAVSSIQGAKMQVLNGKAFTVSGN